MNKDTALKKGLVATGHYTRLYPAERYETMVKKCEEIKKKGYKAYIVGVPDSPLSRGYTKGGKGYAIYTEPRYQKDQQAEECRAVILAHPTRIKDTKAYFQELLTQALKELQDNHDAKVNWLKENGYDIPVAQSK